MDLYQHQLTKYNIPLNHLDHEYIRGCNDASEIENIIKILRSKEEGHYPDLERLAEERLGCLRPKSKLLWKPSKLLSSSDLNEEERSAMELEIKDWEESMGIADKDLNARRPDMEFDRLPPVRDVSATIRNEVEKKPEGVAGKTHRGLKPREYSEWDKLDLDMELKKVDEEMKNLPVKPKEKIRLEEVAADADLPDQLKAVTAEREKNKGNEAFKAGDYDEAIIYYSRSLSITGNVPAYNNRAQIYLNIKKWKDALEDCNSVINLDPHNVKAHMRRAVAHQGLAQFVRAQVDLQFVLMKEPTNKQALSVLKEVEGKLADQKVSGRRMMIEEVDGSEDEKDCMDARNEGVLEVGDELESKKQSSDMLGNRVTLMENADSGCGVDDPINGGAGGDAMGLVGDPFGVGSALEGLKENEDLSSSSLSVSQSPMKPSSLPSSSSSSHLVQVNLLQSKAEDLFRAGRYGEATDAFGEALRCFGGGGGRPNSSEELSIFESLCIRKATCNYRSGDLPACIRDCDAAIAHNPTSYEALFRKATALEELEKYKEAYVHYKVIPCEDPNGVVAQRSSDRCAAALKAELGSDWRSKLPLLPIPSIPAISPPFSSSSSSSSSQSQQLPQHSSQRTSSPSPSLPEDPNTGVQNAEELYEQCKATGNNFFSKGDYQEAIKCFTKCIELKRDQVVPYANRALCYLKLDQSDLVLEDCNQALTIDFHCTKALYRRALAFKIKSEFNKSLIDLETLLKIDPGNSAAKKEINNINNILRQIKEKKAMEACLRQEKKVRQRINIVEVADPNPTQKCLKEDKQSHSKNIKKSSMPTIATVTKATTTKSIKPIPPTKVTSPYEFMQAYNSIKFEDDISTYVALFDVLQPSHLPTVLSNRLDRDMLMVIVRCLQHFFQAGDRERAREYLRHLVKVERFDMVVMFLDDSDKNEVNAMLDSASEYLEKDFIVQMRLKFRV